MKTTSNKKTITSSAYLLFFAFLLASQSGYAQTEVSGNQTSTSADRYVINDDESSSDAALRLQSKQGSTFNDWMIYNENGDGNLHISNWRGSSHSNANENDIGTKNFTFKSGTGTSSQFSGKFGINVDPMSGLDIHYGNARTGSHASNRPMYITGPIGAFYNGIEFRHYNATQGIGFGYNTIYATGTNPNQELNFQSRGNGNISLKTGSSQDLFINGSNGNVGIGTTSPTHKLQVQGTMKVTESLDVEGLNINAGLGNGISFWSGNNNYKISMSNATDYKYGPVTDFAIKNNMSDSPGRGWTWGVNGKVPVAALNTRGNMKLKGTLDVGGLTINGEGTMKVKALDVAELKIDGDEVFVYSSVNKRLDIKPVTYFGEDVTIEGDLIVEGEEIKWEGRDIGKVSVQFIRTDQSLSFKMKAKENATNYEAYLSLTDVYKNRPYYPEYYRNIGVETSKNLLVPGLLVKDFMMIGLSTGGYTRIDNAALQVDGRVYISEEGVGEEGWDDHTSSNYEDYLLWVEEGIVSTDFAIAEVSDWPDYVFNDDYKLKSLKEVEKNIKENGHLHTMPSAKEVAKNGFTVKDITKRVVKTIEELTLHTIAQEKQIAALMGRLVRLEQMLENKGK